MKKILTAWGLWMVSLCAMALTPTAQDLTPYYSAGQACVCVQFKGVVCNDIIWVGSYNGWTTDVRRCVKFAPVTGFDGWWVVAFDDASSNVMGKAVQLKSDGSFDWQYQSGNSATWTVASGSAQVVGTQGNEAQLEHIDKSQPLIAVSAAWKNNVCPLPADSLCSGTLPVLVIETDGRQPVVSREDYLVASYYLDSRGLPGYESVGRKDSMLTMQIKGRGNWTWNGFAKKPYRLKLDTKQGLLGLKKNKHFGLLAGADDQFSWMKNTMGYALSRQLGLEWTPGQAPVEVVLNGEYIGLYMLTELIRVEKDRVNVVEQADLTTQADSVTGGWLVEIDNYEEPNRIAFTEPANEWHRPQLVWITPKTPEILSQEQSAYLQQQMDDLNAAIYASDSSTSLAAMLDMDEAAKFYLVQELMSDCESYHGSCYMHKQMGDDAKWKFGPVWDFGNSFRDQDRFIYDNPTFSQVWIGQLVKHAPFQEAMLRLWKHWLYYDAESMDGILDDFAEQIAAAAETDAARWPQYNHANVEGSKQNFLGMLHRHITWLTSQWGEGEADSNPMGVENVESETGAQKVVREGRVLILRDGTLYDLTGLRVE